jgi:hypothetical protein
MFVSHSTARLNHHKRSPSLCMWSWSVVITFTLTSPLFRPPSPQYGLFFYSRYCLPVYSVSTPPLLQKLYLRFLSRPIFRLGMPHKNHTLTNRQIFKLRFWPQECIFLVSPFLCFFFPSSSLFFFPTTFWPHHEQLTIYVTTMNDKHRVTLSFSPCAFVSYHDQHLPFASLLLFFLDDRMGWQMI